MPMSQRVHAMAAFIGTDHPEKEVVYAFGQQFVHARALPSPLHAAVGLRWPPVLTARGAAEGSRSAPVPRGSARALGRTGFSPATVTTSAWSRRSSRHPR